jgi:hypothetical protein
VSICLPLLRARSLYRFSDRMRIYVLDRYAKVTKQSYWTVGLDQMTVNGAAVKVHGQDAVIDT